VIILPFFVSRILVSFILDGGLPRLGFCFSITCSTFFEIFFAFTSDILIFFCSFFEAFFSFVLSLKLFFLLTAFSLIFLKNPWLLIIGFI